jgi:hypothetical protein
VTLLNAQAVAEIRRKMDEAGARKNYDLAVKRIGATVRKMRKQGMSDLEIGVMLGLATEWGDTVQVGVTLAAVAEFEGLA